MGIRGNQRRQRDLHGGAISAILLDDIDQFLKLLLHWNLILLGKAWVGHTVEVYFVYIKKSN